MSRIDELIERLCPDGVEYCNLGEVTKVSRGKRVVRKNLDQSEGYPVYQNSLKPLGYYTEANRPAGTTFVICAGAAGDIGYSSEDFWSADDCFCPEANEVVSGRYLYHVLLSMQPRLKAQVRKASIPRLSPKAIENLRIPVPPMEVQQEIVRVLDAYAELEAKLEAELEAELETRHSQFDYYRNRILNDSAEGATMVPLAKVGTFTGSTPKKSEQRFFGDEHPFYKPGDFDAGESVGTSEDGLTSEGLSASRVVPEGSTLVVCIGATIGKVGYVLETGSCNQQINVILPTEDFSSRYVFHLANSRIVQDQIAHLGNFSSMPILSLKRFNQIEIPMPPREVQDTVAAALDQFDAIMHDISYGFPAEIEARRQQYAYYRDKLLTFKEKVA